MWLTRVRILPSGCVSLCCVMRLFGWTSPCAELGNVTWSQPLDFVLSCFDQDNSSPMMIRLQGDTADETPPPRFLNFETHGSVCSFSINFKKSEHVKLFRSTFLQGNKFKVTLLHPNVLLCDFYNQIVTSQIQNLVFVCFHTLYNMAFSASAVKLYKSFQINPSWYILCVNMYKDRRFCLVTVMYW